MTITDPIFCPTCGELILAASSCANCGWSRPAAPGESGAELWHVALGRRLPSPRCYPVLAGGLIAIPTDDGAVVGLRPADGTTAWEHALPAASAAHSLATDGARIFVGPADTRPVPSPGRALLALDGATGRELWRYDCGAHSYSGPAFSDGSVIFTSSDGRIHALDAATGALRWAESHPDWGPASPAASGGVVIAGGRGDLLVAYELASGRELWRFQGGGWFASRPALAAGVAFVRCWDGFIYALDAASGTERWKLKGERGQGFTSTPTFAAGLILVGDRVRQESGASGYALRALRPESGQEAWRFPTERYVSAAPFAAGDTVLCCAEEGRLYALAAADGAERWRRSTAAEPVSRPLAEAGVVFVADREGGVYAARLSPAAAPRSADLLARGDQRGAAEAMARAGDLAGAAQIFAAQLGAPREAARLFEAAGQPGAAAPLWEQAGDPQRARARFREAGDLRGLAAHLARTGEQLEAARVYEEIGQQTDAAALYEQAGDKARAAELYKQIGETDKADVVAGSLGLWEQQVEALIAEDQLAQAAALLQEHGQAERAADLFERAGKLPEALIARLELKHWPKVAQLAEQLGDHDHAAEAYEQMGRHDKAAAAYERAAQRIAASENADERLLAGLYEQAARLYSAISDTERAAACDREVRRLRQLPALRLGVTVEGHFTEREWNTVRVDLFNEGFGPARAIQLHCQGHFELNNALVLAGVAPGRDARQVVSLRSLPGELGQRVPLELSVSFRDLQEREYSAAAEVAFVTVVPRGATPPVATTPPQGVTPPTPREPEPLAVSLRFEIEPDAVQVTWEGEAIGTRPSLFVPPFRGPDLDTVVRALDQIQSAENLLSAADHARLAALLGLPAGGDLTAAQQAVGRAIFRALVADQRAATALSTARDVATHSGRRLDLRLRFPPDAIELAALPWELLWDEGETPLLLSGSRVAGCTRHLDLAAPLPAPRQRQGPLRILAIAPHAGVDPEMRAREQAERTAAWANLIASREVVMQEVSPATRRGLVDAIQSGPPPDIVHFVGHGRYVDNQGWLILDTQGGQMDKVPAKQLTSLFGGAQLVVLCACQGAMAGEAGLLTGVAPALSAAGVPAVVGMQLTVRQTSALRFTEVMYRALARGEALQRAVDQARQALYIEETDGASWYVPTLTIRARDTGPLHLFGA